MLKVGDKYYCIKNRDLYNNVHKSDHVYKITRINLDYDYIGLNTELNIEFDDGYFYSLIPDNEFYYFYDYFITLKEYRKQKLNKLCSK